jgi:NTP pyrophosphatase (non-canonical NTP hydrolase)|tara:strand:+ start:860 stop:1159 length:300 start_codon:yes stop_codon:yes gene_type:complete
MSKEHYVKHLYGVLQEECAELIMAISKYNRFGSQSHLNAINCEINDVKAMVEMLAIEGEQIFESLPHQYSKIEKVNMYYVETAEKDSAISYTPISERKH